MYIRHKYMNLKKRFYTQNICKTFIKRQANVFDVGPTLYTIVYNVIQMFFVFDGYAPNAYIFTFLGVDHTPLIPQCNASKQKAHEGHMAKIWLSLLTFMSTHKTHWS